MKTKNVNQQQTLLKILEDKKAIRECIRGKGDLNKLASDRGIKFSTPI
jgi:hypothetical protein